MIPVNRGAIEPVFETVLGHQIPYLNGEAEYRYPEQHWFTGDRNSTPLCISPLLTGFYSKVSETGSKVSVTQTVSPVPKTESQPI
jgi:hypothetical protein